MKIAYNETSLKNLLIARETRDWSKQGVITDSQSAAISAEYTSDFFHPNLFIRILLFLASLLAIGGVTGLVFLIGNIDSELSFAVVAIIYGCISLAVLERVFIKNMNHYKSGVNEALLYHSLGFLVAGVAGLFDFEEHALIAMMVIACAVASFRYADLVCSIVSVLAFAYWIFYILYEMGDQMRQIIPLAMIAVFTVSYFVIRRLRSNDNNHWWDDCLLVVEAISLILVYAGGNYFVVRELSESMLEMYLQPGEDIPLAFVFYGLTVIIPFVYLYFGIKRKDIVLLRVSLLVLAFSAFTFKYYFSMGHPEFTLTGAGILLLVVAIALYKFLASPRHGYTREKLMSEKWAESNPEAILVSQTLGGNKPVLDESMPGGGGTFGGGGATGSY